MNRTWGKSVEIVMDRDYGSGKREGEGDESKLQIDNNGQHRWGI
jgi:hypothetical protein